MTPTITTLADLDVSLMSELEYVAYQRGLEDQLIERYYARGLPAPGMTSLPSALADLQPPF
jgi:hypothetical protein